MNILVGLIVAVVVLYIAYEILTRVSDEEYLELLTRTSWKSDCALMEEMRKKKWRFSINEASFFGAMARLEDKNLVERRTISEKIDDESSNSREYRLVYSTPPYT